MLVLLGAYGLAVMAPDLAALPGQPGWQRIAVVAVELALVVACAVAWRRPDPARLVASLYTAVFAALLVRGCLIGQGQMLLACAAALLIVATASRVVAAGRIDRLVRAAVLGAIALGVLDLLPLPTRLPGEAEDLPRQLVAPAVLVALSALAVREFSRYPLATKLTLVSLLVALAPLLIARLASQRSLAAVDLELALADMSARTSNSAADWDHLFARQLAALRGLAADDAVVAACAGERTPALERRLAALVAGPVSSVMLWDRGGWLLVGAGPEAPPHGPVPRDSLPRPGVNLSVDEHGVDRLVLAAPVQASDGSTRGTVAFALRPGLLRDWSAAVAAEARASVVLRDRDDRPLFTSADPELVASLPGFAALPPPSPHTGTPGLPLPPVGAAAHLGGGRGLVGVAPLSTAGWTLAVVRDEAEILARVAARERHMQGITLLVAALACLAAFLLSRRLARPIVKLAAAMVKFTDGHTDARAPATDDDEIGELARRFDLMAEQVGGLVRSLEQQTRRLQAEVAERSEQEQKLQTLNKELTSAHDQAQAASRAKSTFLAHMSHELRTPLNAIIGYAEMLRDGDHGNPDVVRDADHIVQSAQHLLEIINEILDLSKIEAGKMDLVLEEFDGVRLVRDLAEVVRPVVAANNNRLTVRCEFESVRLYSDRLKLRQALLNLLGNAGKFTHDGEVSLALETTTLGGLPCVCFRVQDTGPGIPPDALPTLFDPFTQVHGPSQRKQSGTGLGLAITRRFARLLGGEIDVVSEVGVGSTFTLTLPTTYKGRSETGSWRPLRSFRKLEETSKGKPA